MERQHIKKRALREEDVLILHKPLPPFSDQNFETPVKKCRVKNVRAVVLFRRFGLDGNI